MRGLRFIVPWICRSEFKTIENVVFYNNIKFDILKESSFIHISKSINIIDSVASFKKDSTFFFGHGAKTKKKKPNPWAMTELRVHSVTTARCSNTTPPHLSVNFHSNPNDCYPQFASRCLILSTNTKSNRPPYHTIHNPKMKIKTNPYQ